MDVAIVFVASLVTALCTGIGVLPFLLSKNISKRALGLGNALAAGLMMGASIGLAWEAYQLSLPRTCIGLAIGYALIWASRYWLPEHDLSHATESEEENQNQSGIQKILLVMFVMTLHSFAEGMGVGVAYGGREGFGNLVSSAIAIHNIPEGLAIGLVMIPRGVSVAKAGLWSIFSSLPQPLMAVPAFLFVQSFVELLPVGLGLASGAMVYMAIFELLPDSLENESKLNVGTAFTIAVAAMLTFQILLT